MKTLECSMICALIWLGASGCLLASPVCVDNFDDNSPNLSFWRVSTGSNRTVAEANGRLEVSIDSAAAGSVFGAGYTSNRGLIGDFDVQVDYRLLTWPARNGVRVGLVMGGAWNVERVSRGLGETVGEEYSADYGISVFPRINTPDQNGTLRMVRSGAHVTSYYYSSGGWTPILAANLDTRDIGWIGLHAWSHDYTFGHQQVQVAFDNFTINSGQLVPEPPSVLPLIGCLGMLATVMRRRYLLSQR